MEYDILVLHVDFETRRIVHYGLRNGYPDSRSASFLALDLYESSHSVSKSVYYEQAESDTAGAAVTLLIYLEHSFGYCGNRLYIHSDTRICHFNTQIDSVIRVFGIHPYVDTAFTGEFLWR